MPSGSCRYSSHDIYARHSPRKMHYATAALTAALVAGAHAFAVTSCYGANYFDAASLSCQSCAGSAGWAPSNATIGPTGDAVGCGCIAGYATAPPPCSISSASLTGCPTPVCSACAPFASSRTNASACVPCGASTLGLDATGDCACFSGGSGASALVETDAAGVPLGRKECLLCPPRTLVLAGDRTACAACADPHATMTATGACVCDAGRRATGIAAYTVGQGGGIACVDSSAAAALLTTTESTSASVSFWSIQVSASSSTALAPVHTLTSSVVMHMYLASAVGCAGARPGDAGGTAACQVLANLCVMNLYSPLAAPCALLASIATARGAGAGATNGFSSWPAPGTPFTQYRGAENAGADCDASLTLAMAFDGGWTGVVGGLASAPNAVPVSDVLSFILVSFSLNGSFGGLQRLSTQLGEHCSDAGAGGADPSWLRFGHTESRALTCDVGKLLAAHSKYRFGSSSSGGGGGGWPLPDASFYELYVVDEDAAGTTSTLGGGASLLSAAGIGITDPVLAAALSSLYRDVLPPLALYPVPVRMTNYRAADGSLPNVNAGPDNVADDVFVRRFMIVDAVSGVASPGAPPQIIRYASSISLSITGRSGKSAPPMRVFVPVLTISYRERLVGGSGGVLAAVAARGAGGGLDAYALDTLAVVVEYAADPSDFNYSVLSIGIALGVQCALYSSIRVTAWTRRNARNALEASWGVTHALQFVIAASASCAAIGFWFLWLICEYWFISVKLLPTGSPVPVLLPPLWPPYAQYDYAAFSTALIACWTLYAVRLLGLLNRQVSADVFFLDWERPRGQTAASTM